MMHIKVSNNAVEGLPFTLAKNYVTPEGATITNVLSLSATEKVALGLYPYIAVAHAAWETVVAYAINAADVTATFTAMPLADYKLQEVDAAYRVANRALDALVAGYSQLEVATWPAIQADILAYGVDGTVGAAMQGAIDSSGYDAAGLAALILPRIQQQADIYVDRKAQVVAIMAAATHSEV